MAKNDPTREQRLAEQLRANLRRRKAAALTNGAGHTPEKRDTVPQPRKET